MKPLKLNILTPEKELFAGEATFLAARAADGEIGVLADHAPLITVLAPGPVRYQLTNGEEVRLDGGEGFLIVSSGSASVLLNNHR